MSVASAPFGLRAAYHPSGIIRPNAFTLASAYNANILSGQPVKIGANGTIEAAAIADRIIGAFAGCEYTDSDGRRRQSNKWTANQVGLDAYAFATYDPSIVYEIQANGPIAISDIGSQINPTVVGAGSAIIGLSQMMADVATLTNTGNGMFRIIGIASGPNNAPGDAYTIIQVQIAKHQNVADIVAY